MFVQDAKLIRRRRWRRRRRYKGRWAHDRDWGCRERPGSTFDNHPEHHWQPPALSWFKVIMIWTLNTFFEWIIYLSFTKFNRDWQRVVKHGFAGAARRRSNWQLVSASGPCREYYSSDSIWRKRGEKRKRDTTLIWTVHKMCMFSNQYPINHLSISSVCKTFSITVSSEWTTYHNSESRHIRNRTGSYQKWTCSLLFCLVALNFFSNLYDFLVCGQTRIRRFEIWFETFTSAFCDVVRSLYVK